MYTCRICGETFYIETQSEPGELCWCGECCDVGLWRYYGTVGGVCRGVVLKLRFHIARLLYSYGDWFTGSNDVY